jgi:hypothetical protein
MENKDLKFHQVIHRLRSVEPILYDADALTNRIMQKIEQTEVRSTRIFTMRLSGIISGVAASALIAMFAFETLQQHDWPAKNIRQAERMVAVEKIHLRGITEISTEERERIIEHSLRKRKEQTARKERLFASFLYHNSSPNTY